MREGESAAMISHCASSTLQTQRRLDDRFVEHLHLIGKSDPEISVSCHSNSKSPFHPDLSVCNFQHCSNVTGISLRKSNSFSVWTCCSPRDSIFILIFGNHPSFSPKTWVYFRHLFFLFFSCL